MNRIIAIATGITAAFAFSATTLVQAQSVTEKIEKAGAANTKATEEARAKKRADADAREKAAKEERDKNQGKLKAKINETAEGVQKKQAEEANKPKPKKY